MASRIEIDINAVRNTNYKVPGIENTVENIEREINMIRWRIPNEVLDESGIRDRLEKVSQDLRRVERKLGDIYSVTSNNVSQYMNLEERLTKNAEQFQ